VSKLEKKEIDGILLLPVKRSELGFTLYKVANGQPFVIVLDLLPCDMIPIPLVPVKTSNGPALAVSEDLANAFFLLLEEAVKDMQRKIDS